MTNFLLICILVTLIIISVDMNRKSPGSQENLFLALGVIFLFSLVIYAVLIFGEWALVEVMDLFLKN